MSDPYNREPTPPQDRTVVVNNDRSRGGGAGWLIAGILIAAVVIGGIFLFGGFGGSGGGDVSINVPEVETPDVNIEVPAAPSGEAPAQ